MRDSGILIESNVTTHADLVSAKKSMKTKLVIYQDNLKEYRWRLVATNGKIVAVSEGYETRFGAQQSALNLKGWVNEAEIVNL